MYSGAHGHGWSSSSSSASPAPPGTAVAWGGAEVGPTTPAAAEGSEHGQPQPLQPPYEVYAHSYYPQEAHAAYPYAAPPSSSAHFATAHTLPPAIPSGAALGFTPQQSADSQQQHIPSPHLPVYQHSSYSHANIPSAVESARWTGASSSYDDQAGSLRWDAGAAGPGTPAWLAINDQRRWSVASSTDSSASNSRSPIVGGSSVLPFDADEPASPPVEIKAFVQKLYNMLADPDHYQDVLLWNHDGDAFFVAHNERFVNEVLPSAFGHSNIHSFTRTSSFDLFA
ncbi:hypothetical protein Rhopal_005263-T1 [Rhodotorula paludigena]|uniref:HSF-type DNA-binding domain-containing protein n=1 Tax=Rhodotorula paludigena TaxID=86838 RepID=A0AAV5GPY9_9BASI|nr:hypothetical protein Rhopal_005263-T1 [Rhodotorula paludigena]